MIRNEKNTLKRREFLKLTCLSAIGLTIQRYLLANENEIPTLESLPGIIISIKNWNPVEITHENIAQNERIVFKPDINSDKYLFSRSRRWCCGLESLVIDLPSGWEQQDRSSRSERYEFKETLKLPLLCDLLSGKSYNFLIDEEGYPRRIPAIFPLSIADNGSILYKKGAGTWISAPPFIIADFVNKRKIRIGISETIGAYVGLSEKGNRGYLNHFIRRDDKGIATFHIFNVDDIIESYNVDITKLQGLDKKLQEDIKARSRIDDMKVIYQGKGHIPPGDTTGMNYDGNIILCQREDGFYRIDTKTLERKRFELTNAPNHPAELILSPDGNFCAYRLLFRKGLIRVYIHQTEEKTDIETKEDYPRLYKTENNGTLYTSSGIFKYMGGAYKLLR